MINQRLFDHYRIDTQKDLRITKSCARPFDTVLIDKRGSCYACECTAWLPQSIGNLQIQELGDIVGSTMHKHLQGSIADGTYRYCNQAQCAYLRSGGFYEATEQCVKHIRLAIDDSCNLRCPSCRRDMIFHKRGSAYDLGTQLADKINKWLHDHTHPLQVHIGSDGDPFASHVYRHFMEHTPRRDNIKYSILTNGLMFKEFHHRVPNVVQNLNQLGVSIDGASKRTYEQLRLGGRWDKITEALDFVAQQKQKHGFRFDMYFVVQKHNYHEMGQIMELGIKHNADKVYLSRIQDWNTLDNFSEHNIFDSAHPQHTAFQQELVDLENKYGTLDILDQRTLRQLH
jgi:sulfatase maturation enzyme AslB (radical SAM superfamily)